jgi:RimJ/RimL family protein N-acetyltransferase
MYVCLTGASIETTSKNREPELLPIGVVSLSKSEERQMQHGRSSLSLMISRAHQCKGYGREATNWALGWAFDYARLHRVEVSCYSWNEGAIRLYASIGFREEGVKREAVWFMGSWRDIHEMAVLDHEWRELKPERSHTVSDEDLGARMASR